MVRINSAAMCVSLMHGLPVITAGSMKMRLCAMTLSAGLRCQRIRGAPEGDRLDVLVTLVEAREAQHFNRNLFNLMRISLGVRIA